MFTSTFTRAMLALGSLAVLAVNAAPAPSAHNLPIFFFHGINSAATSGDLLKANLSTDARPFIGLTSCETFCTLSDLNTQADLAAKEIRGIVANDSRFDNGYLFIGHSLGGAVARAVIETMDDHKVHSFFSLAGANNGLAYGSQESDVFAAHNFLKYYAPVFYGSLINASSYSVADIQSGKLTADLATLLPNHPELAGISGIQFARSPVQDEWIKYNTFYAPLNNLQAPTTEAIKTEQARRKKNFLKLKEAHFFGSPFDETISPWQSSQLGAYQPVASVAEWTANFKNIKVQTYTETVEYKQDTYGLQTLDKRGGVFMHTIESVTHNGWIRDTTGPRDGKSYTFKPVYEQGLYPLIAPDATVTTPTPTTPKPYC